MVYGFDMDTPHDEGGSIVRNSMLYREFLREEEILRHKWIESEKAGHDIGFERALLDWVMRHAAAGVKAAVPMRTVGVN